MYLTIFLKNGSLELQLVHPSCFNLLHAVGASIHQIGVSYLRNLSGSLDILYTPSQEVIQRRMEFALPRIHNTPWNIRVLAFTRKYYAKRPCLICQLFSAPPHLV